MAGITNDKLFEAMSRMAEDVATIKKVIEPLPGMFKDIYIGNGEPPLRDTCREYLEEKRIKETAKTVAATNKLDFSNKVKLQIIGGVIALAVAQTGLVLAAINWIPLFFK